ncbi:HAD family hydrolase [Curtobacterium sp. VKM Ac-2922]|uniref:HAD family hydrolase n=1 Tax=Curtobacterium sp. VKM Ac-2922 TaxID=2929475 RepID=UPI001FB21EE2|nr:HAD family hydrolase [Curtobacterium sp. VKM Ac-2922]MCJ1714907.1 HAD family hydrolase [Curtobacterium sp. VKM Ac-2922]
MTVDLPPGLRCIVFDVGETLVDETSSWSSLAVAAGITPFTLMASLGVLIDRDQDHRRVWSMLGVDRPRTEHRLASVDLYPDALACLRAVGTAGLKVGIAGNQPTRVEAELRAVGFAPDFIASSARWGVEKPSPEFFERVVAESGLRPTSILYVGDRLDNDVLPARRAGMRTAHLRRGPWGHVHAARPEAELADLRLGSLTELTATLTD